MSEACLWLIPLLPLLGSIVIAAAGRRWFAEWCHIPCIAGAIGACVLSIIVFITVGASGPIAVGKSTVAAALARVDLPPLDDLGVDAEHTADISLGLDPRDSPV